MGRRRFQDVAVYTNEEGFVHGALYPFYLPSSLDKVFADLDRVGLGANLDVLAAKAECCYEQVSDLIRCSATVTRRTRSDAYRACVYMCFYV